MGEEGRVRRGGRGKGGGKGNTNVPNFQTFNRERFDTFHEGKENIIGFDCIQLLILKRRIRERGEEERGEGKGKGGREEGK